MAELKDGDSTLPSMVTMVEIGAPSKVDLMKPNLEGNTKRKRRRGKYKRKITKPFLKVSWPDRRKYNVTKKNNRFRKMVMANTHAPFNNNQFLMEIHKPEPENNYQNLQTPSARTRDSSFSVDSEDNYFYSLPEDEEEYLTKEFSSVYEDAQCERLSNMSKSELIQEYLLLEVKYENVIKRTERSKIKYAEDDSDAITDKDVRSATNRESDLTEKNISGTSMESSDLEEQSVCEIMQRMKEQENHIRELQIANEKLRIENERLRQRSHSSSSADSESDSSTSISSCCSDSSVELPPVPIDAVPLQIDNNINTHNLSNVQVESIQQNGFHNPDDPADSVFCDE